MARCPSSPSAGRGCRGDRPRRPVSRGRTGTVAGIPSFPSFPSFPRAFGGNPAGAHAFISHSGTKRELPLAIADDGAGQRSELYRQWHDTMRTTATDLLRRAQDAGVVRGDLDVADLLASAGGIGHAAADDEQVGRLLGILRDGLTTR